MITTRKRRTAGNGRHGHLKGGVRPPEHAIWKMMNQKCNNPSCSQYPRFGGLGVRVCAKWREINGFANFLEDMGKQPYPGAGLKRLDPAGHFEPGNVTWDDTKTGRILTHNGRSQSINAWAKEINLRPGTIRTRLSNGWTVEHALSRKAKHRFYAKRKWWPAEIQKQRDLAAGGNEQGDEQTSNGNELSQE